MNKTNAFFNADFVLLNGFALPLYQRIEYWTIEQKKSGYSPIVFWKLLRNKCWQIEATMIWTKKDHYVYDIKLGDGSGIRGRFIKAKMPQLIACLEKLRESFDEPLNKADNKEKARTPTHREEIFAHKFKEETKEAGYKTATQWYKEKGGRGRIKTAFGTTIERPKKYRPPDERELENIIKLLEGYEAQKIAINLLDKLQNKL